jgi:hypothetical protein
MKATMLATAVVLSLGVGSAYADSEGVSTVDTQFTQRPGVMAQAPVQNAPPVGMAQKGQPLQGADNKDGAYVPLR